MDSDYLQFIRYKLQKRLKRLNMANDVPIFSSMLLQCWKFLQDNAVAKGILDDLERRFPDSKREVDLALEGALHFGESEDEHCGIAYWTLKTCATCEDGPERIHTIMHRFDGNGPVDYLEGFRAAFVEPLFDYLDEHIDDQRMILTLLKKYKHRCEWFRRSELYEACKAETQKGERILAYDLYEYLHDQGLQFHMEPESASGRVDLISAQTGRDRLVADTKIFNPGGGQSISYLAKGFRQVYDYTRDYNEQFGYIVIFKTCEEDLSIQTQFQESSIPLMVHNHKAIFLLVIDIFPYDKSASKRGTLKTHEITAEDLIKAAATADTGHA